MAINLKPPAKQQSFTGTNPLQSFQNPVEDFLAPFKQQKTELEGKINEMTSGQAPKSMSQDINESNWQQFQGSNPDGPNYQPQSLIDYFRTGKTTSESMDNGVELSPEEKKANQEKFFRDARYNSAMQDPNVSGVTKFVGGMLHGIDNLTGGRITKGTQSMSTPNALSEFDPNALISGIKDVGGDIKNTTNEAGNFFQNKAPGLDEAKQQGRFITQEQLDKKIEKAILDMPDATDEEIAQAIGQLKNEGYFFEGMNEKNSPTYEKIRDFIPGLGEATDLLGGATKMGGQFIGGTLHGGATYSEGGVNLLEGNTNLGASKMLSGITELGTSILGGAFPVATSIFNTETVEPVVDATLGNVQKGVSYVTNKGLDLTGMDPNSEEYKNYSNALTTIGTILTTMGIVKGTQIGFRKTFGENLTYENTKVSDFVQNTGKTAEDLQNAINQVRPNANIKITDSTPISKVFTPEEFTQMQAMARNAGVSGVGRKEGFISDAMQTKIGEKVAEYTGKIGETIKQGVEVIKNKQTIEKGQPLSKNEGNAITSDGHIYTMENTPGTIQRTYKGIFTSGTDADLAMRAFNPSVQGLTQSQKMDIGNTMLEGAKTLHNEQVKGNITADTSTMEGAMEGIQQAKELHGGIIGEVTGIDGKFSMNSEIKALQDGLEKRGATISPDLNNLAKNILEDFATYGPDITIAEAQRLMSTIKSVVFSDPVKIKQLSGTISGSALDSFLKAFEAKFESAIESNSGRFPELQASRSIYRQMKQIEKSLANSLIIEARNQAKKGGLSNTVGNIAALAEIARNPSLSAMASAAMIKIIASEIGKGKTRNAAFERLMENFKVADIKRAKGKIPYEKKEQPKRNKFNEDIKKQQNKTLLPKPSGKTPSAVNVKGEVIAEDGTIPLKASDAEVISGSKKDIQNAKIDTQKPKPEGRRLLPAPRTPEGTTLPRTDIVAESMRGVNSQRPGTTKEIIPRGDKSKKDTSRKDLLDKVNATLLESAKTPEESSLIMAELSKKVPAYEIVAKLQKMREGKKDLTSQEESSKMDSPSKKTTMSEQDLLDKMNSEYFDSLKNPADKNLMTAELSKGAPLYEIIAKINKSKSSKKEIIPKSNKKLIEESKKHLSELQDEYQRKMYKYGDSPSEIQAAQVELSGLKSRIEDMKSKIKEKDPSFGEVKKISKTDQEKIDGLKHSLENFRSKFENEASENKGSWVESSRRNQIQAIEKLMKKDLSLQELEQAYEFLSKAARTIASKDIINFVETLGKKQIIPKKK